MKNAKTFKATLICVLVFTLGLSQNEPEINRNLNQDLIQTNSTMQTYLIESEIPEVGKEIKKQLQGLSQKSNTLVAEISNKIERAHSFVTGNKVYYVNLPNFPSERPYG